jgi:hypothetical protein
MKHSKQFRYSDEPVETALAVLASGWATLEAISEALVARRARRPTIGELLLKEGKLNVSQVFRILEEQATSSKLFGQIAIEMGYLSESDLQEMLDHQSWLCPPLWEVLESHGAITSTQSDVIQEKVRSRLRQSAEEMPLACEA